MIMADYPIPADQVAPHAGAWIETYAAGDGVPYLVSHPTRVRGLKHRYRLVREDRSEVAPHAGAWIET